VLRALPSGTVRITSQNVVTTTPAIASTGSIPLGQQQIQIASTQSLQPVASATPGSVVDLTQEDTVDSREITFNKLSGKTFPSLVVSARPNLRVKDMTPSAITKERANLGKL
jgi:pogo transposable element with ZNF domain